MEIVNIKDIIPDENQPRELFDAEKLGHLQRSIEQHGILNPLMVEKIGEKYLIVDGERRFRAATAANLRVIPVTIMKPQNAVERLIEQFHVQEQHEGWTATEKANALVSISDKLGVPLRKVCEMMNLGARTADMYMAFSSLLEKKTFQKTEVPIKWASYIHGIKLSFKKIYIDTLGKEFTLEDQRKTEKAMISRIKDGTLETMRDVSKIKDAAKKDPKIIEKFLDDPTVTPDQMFLSTKAGSAYHLRNVVANASWMSQHVRGFFASGSEVGLTLSDVSSLKIARKCIDDLLHKGTLDE